MWYYSFLACDEHTVLIHLCYIASVTAEKWVPIIEVRVNGVKNFLEKKKQEGFAILGLEQTANSIPLDKYCFPQKTVNFFDWAGWCNLTLCMVHASNPCFFYIEVLKKAMWRLYLLLFLQLIKYSLDKQCEAFFYFNSVSSSTYVVWSDFFCAEDWGVVILFRFLFLVVRKREYLQILSTFWMLVLRSHN